jgi:hypothetical protein
MPTEVLIKIVNLIIGRRLRNYILIGFELKGLKMRINDLFKKYSEAKTYPES